MIKFNIMFSLKAKYHMLKGVLTKKIPLYVQFAVTKRCNLRCQMCQTVESRKGEKELTLQEIGRIADILSEMGVGILVLTGGEPLLRHDIADIVRSFASKGINTRLQTTGMLITDGMAADLIDAGLKDITVSLDSLDPEKQDFINNAKGSWVKVIKGMSVFSRHLPRRGGVSGVNIVVTKLNVQEVPDVVSFVTDVGFYASIIPVHLADSDNSSFIVRKDAPPLAFVPDDFPLIDNTYARLLSMKKRGYLIQNSSRFLRESPDFIKYKKTYWRCDSPYLYFSISPAGNFLPCVDINTTETMLDGDFLKRYRSREFIQKMEQLVRDCSGCMYACWPEVSYFCRDISVFSERVIQGLKMGSFERKVVSYDEMIVMAEKTRKEKSDNTRNDYESCLNKA